jgi:hypothetical protein
MTLTPLQRAPYVREVHDLASTLLQRLTELEVVSAAWKQQDRSADQQLDDESQLDVDQFAVTLRAIGDGQTSFFILLESFLAAWARLSLLFFPIMGEASTEKHRSERAEALCKVLGIGGTSTLADRELRNAWMHFDERLDSAIVQNTFGDRHRFVRSNQAGPLIEKTLRLMEVDTLLVRYKKKDGTSGAFDVRSTRNELERLFEASSNPLAG